MFPIVHRDVDRLRIGCNPTHGSMGYELENRLVVDVASSALFDLSESDAVFLSHGEDAYRHLQKDT